MEVILRRLGDDVVVVDHWTADLLAIGVARRDERQRLAYFSVCPGGAERPFCVALENPPEPGDKMPHIDVGSQGDLTLSEAAEITAKHLGIC